MQTQNLVLVNNKKVTVHSSIEEGVKTPTFLIVSFPVHTVTCSDPERLHSPNYFNGCESNLDIIQFLSSEIKDKAVKDAKLIFRYNQPDEQLYATTRFIVKGYLTEEQIKLFCEAFETACNTQDSYALNLIENEEGLVYTAIINTDQEEKEFFVGHIHIEIPKDHYWLAAVFDTPEKMAMYEDFMRCPIMYRRFVRLCTMKKIPIPAEATCSVELPIHKRDKNTGEILISATVLNTFKQYQFCQNFLNINEFPKDSAEHLVGKLMMLYPPFCDFMMETALDAEQGKSHPNFEEAYNKAASKAIKYVEQDAELSEFYDQYWS